MCVGTECTTLTEGSRSTESSVFKIEKKLGKSVCFRQRKVLEGTKEPGEITSVFVKFVKLPTMSVRSTFLLSLQ